jgi:hypothetical protein
LALWLPATPVVKEPLTQDAGFVEAKFTEQFPDLFLVSVDQIAAGFGVHTAESFAQRPDSTADTIARFDHDRAAAAPLEVVRSSEPRKPAADDQHRCAGHGK